MDSRSHRHSHTSSRKRSRSPRDDSRPHDVKRHRSRSPHRHSHHHHQREAPPAAARLPFRAHHLHKRDFEAYKPLFAEYLDLQKQLDFSALKKDEVKGRWKSFLNKWNRRELAEGWYDSETKSRADARYVEAAPPPPELGPERARTEVEGRGDESDEDKEDDGYGPALPETARSRSGPAIPGFQDLQQRRELVAEDRDARRADIRNERKHDRKAQKERLEELLPRAEPGSRERQLEKKREIGAANRAFRDAKEGEEIQEIGESELMGDDVDDFKAKKRVEEKRKNEREVRKEEVLRARAAEREERLKEHRRKEEKTMEMLREIAQQRFGHGPLRPHSCLDFKYIPTFMEACKDPPSAETFHHVRLPDELQELIAKFALLGGEYWKREPLVLDVEQGSETCVRQQERLPMNANFLQVCKEIRENFGALHSERAILRFVHFVPRLQDYQLRTTLQRLGPKPAGFNLSRARLVLCVRPSTRPPVIPITEHGLSSVADLLPSLENLDCAVVVRLDDVNETDGVQKLESGQLGEFESVVRGAISSLLRAMPAQTQITFNLNSSGPIGRWQETVWLPSVHMARLLEEAKVQGTSG